MIDSNKEGYLATQGLNDAISHLEQAVKVDNDYREPLNLAYALYNSITNARIKRR